MSETHFVGKLTPQQQEIVDSNSKRLLVLSCAGSGKTLVITERIARLLREGVSPSSILVLAFSNRATQEMRIRINRLEANTQPMTIKTFHAFGLDLIRRHSDVFGFSNSKVSIIKKNEKLAIFKQMKSTKHIPYEAENVLDAISLMKNGIDTTYKLNDEIFEEYNESLVDSCRIDMDDMIYMPYKVLKDDSDFRSYISNQYRYIFVDEYQDTNLVQNKLLELLTNEHTSLCLVGDDDQSIYVFRGGRPDFIRTLANNNHYECHYLTYNFRSQGAIISVARELIAKNKERVEKQIQPALDSTSIPSFKRFSSQKEEAKQVANEIERLVASKRFLPSDIAVLFRENAQSDAIEQALTERNIRFGNSNNNPLAGYSRFTSVLKYIADQTSVSELTDALNFPSPIMNAPVFKEAKQAYQDLFGEHPEYSNETWLRQLYFSDISFKNCDEYRERYSFLEQIQKMSSWSATEVITFYLTYLEEKGYNTDYAREYHYALQVFYMAINYEESYGDKVSLKEFIDHLVLTIEQEEYCETYETESVNLLTMHGAKGLEFKVVFIIGVQVGVFPKPSHIQTLLDLEVERRLFYVAITRAKELLYFSSYSDPFTGSLESSYVKVGFMAEIPKISYTDKPISDEVLSILPAQRANVNIHKLVNSVRSKMLTGHVDETMGETTIQNGHSEKKFEISDSNIKMTPQDALVSVLNQNIELSDGQFIVIIGDLAMKTNEMQSTLKKHGITHKQYECYNYYGKGRGSFNINRIANNPRCVGVIVGPIAHSIKGLDHEGLIGIFKNNPETYPYCVNLIDRRITSKSLVEGISRIKMNLAQRS